MRHLLLTVFASLLLLGSAHAAGKPRLGTYGGELKAHIMTGRGVGDSTHAEKVNFRVNGRRLYVTMQGGAWRQSFRVTSDTVKDGVRSIAYERDSGHGVLARNEARLVAKDPTAPIQYRGFQGSGIVQANGRGAGWRNIGLARLVGTENGKPVELLTSWDETFSGTR